MRKLLVLFAAVLLGLATLAPPATAAEASSLNRKVSGTFSGSSVFDFDTPICTFAHQVYDGTYGPRSGHRGTFHLDGCVDDFGPGTGFAYSGTFVVTASNRAQLRGTVSGSIGAGVAGPCSGPGDLPASLDFSLAVTSGTKNFKHARGTIHVTGTWCSPARGGVPGPITGTFAGALT